MKKLTFAFIATLLNLAVLAQIINPTLPDPTPAVDIPGMNLVWADEFNVIGKPNPEFWKFEKGFIRNEELQWYQEENASCRNGVLLIEGRRQQVTNPKSIRSEAGTGNSTERMRIILHRASTPVVCNSGCMGGLKSGHASTPPWVRGRQYGHWGLKNPGHRTVKSTSWNFTG